MADLEVLVDVDEAAGFRWCDHCFKSTRVRLRFHTFSNGGLGSFGYWVCTDERHRAEELTG